MGYTSYWNTTKWSKKDKEGFVAALPAVQDIFERYKDIIQFECGDPKPAVANKKMIRFNGIDDDGHETFIIFNKKKQSEYGKGDFAFCKTARKPYDIVVCEVLLVLSAYMPGLEVSSDGWTVEKSTRVIDGEWEKALQNVEKHYGHVFKKKIEDRDNSPWADVELIPDKFVSAVVTGMTKEPTAIDLLRRVEEWDKEMTNDEPIAGTDMVDWFCSFYQDAKKVLEKANA